MKKIVLVLVALAIAGYVFLQLKNPAPTSAPTVSPANQVEATPTSLPQPSSEVSSNAEEKVIEVSGQNFLFDKKEIRVKKGEKIAINFTNMDGFHDFVIDELSVKTKTLTKGQSEKVIISTDKPGKYAYYCSVGEHRKNGMEGTLIVE